MAIGLFKAAQCAAFAFLVLAHVEAGAQSQFSIPPRASVQLGFSPGEGALDLVLATIQGARKSILVAAYSFTSRPVATALVDAQRRGVTVYVVADGPEAGKGYSAVSFLANQGVPVRSNTRFPLMHSKFMVVDGLHVQTGSFNYTAAGARNAENVLVLRDVPAVAAEYGRNWKQLWLGAEPFSPRY
jgi:phosphatidylserine/phosphatidylglycerophosphate/cardiolipin synthase-like enzyme